MDQMPWWLDDERMLRPLWIPDVAGALEAIKRLPATDGVTYVWPGEPGYAEATDRIIDWSCGLVEWADKAIGTVQAFGHMALLRHGFINGAAPRHYALNTTSSFMPASKPSSREP